MAFALKCKHLFSLTFIFLLSACAGGGGDSGSSSGTSPFTAWSSVAANKATPLTGASGATGNITFGSSRNISAISMNSGTGAGATFSAAAGDTFYQGIGNGTIFAVNKQNVGAVVVNPYDAGFEYQTFGAWGSYADGPKPTNTNAVSLGSVTTVTGMPATGSANFAGYAAGFFYQGAAGYFTTANMNAGVDFAARTIAFSTNSTLVSGAATGAATVANPSLNMTGFGTYASGTSKFNGNVSTENGMIGTMSGQFYGPNANEIGGTYSVNGSQGTAIGGFGGKR